jgi:ribosomal-protein-alanine N-acetyltransferase
LPASSRSDDDGSAAPRLDSAAAEQGAPAPALGFVPIGPDQLEQLVTLFERNHVAQVTELFDPFPLDSVQARRIALESHRDRFYLAVSGERPIGFSMLRGFDDGYTIPSFGIFVDRESHGEGVGRALTTWTVEQARMLGCAAVRLTVYAANVPARRLYESLGFVEHGRQPVQRAGVTDEKLTMILELGG